MKMMKQVSNRSAIFAPAVQSVRSTVALSCFLIQILLLCNFGRGHSAPGGGYINPSMYGSHQNTIQQQWPTQQEQLQQNQYYDTDQYQQQQHQQQPFEGSTGAVEPCVPPPLPPGWSEHIDPSSGRPYYYNSNDGSTSWDRPPPLPSVNETSADNDGTHQQQYDTTQSFPPSAQEHSNSTDSQEELSRPDSGNTDMIDPPYQKNPTSSIEQAIPPSSDGDALTSISRDENKIIEEEHWRETQGWNVPTERTDDSHKRNADVESDTSKIQQSQGWNLPPMQNRGWGISEPPPSRSEGAPTNLEEQQQILQTRNVDPYRTSEATFPTPNQAHQHQNHQLYDGSKTTPESGIPSSTGLPNSSNSPNLPRIGTDRANGNPVPPNHQHRGPESNLPINQVSPPPASIDGRNPHRGSQHQAIQQDSPRYIQQPPTSSSRPPQLQGNPYQYSQQRPGVTENQPYPPHQGGYGQPPQHQDGGQYRQTQQYPGRPMYNSYPPSTQQSYSSQAGGQLIAQEQQNLVKESLGRTWQSILGLKDKTKEVVETATSTVAQSAREATQTIAEKGTGWWGQAKSVIGSVFESEPTQEYSLSGIYGNAPAPTKQDPSPSYSSNQNYPPQSRYPPPQHYPPQGAGPQQLPPQGRYPPGYGPPKPRVDAPYPYHQQESRQAMPPVQRQYDSNSLQQNYSQQRRPYEPSRNEDGQPNRVGQHQSQQQQHHQRKPEDSNSAWAHPGLTSDY